MWGRKSYRYKLSTSEFLRMGAENSLSKGSWRHSSNLNKFSRYRKSKLINNVHDISSVTNNDLIIVEGCSEGGKQLRVLIDHASQAELISESAAHELRKTIVSSDMKLATAQGASLEISGQVNLELCIGDHKSHVRAQVVDKLSPSYDLIVGIGWLNSHDTILRTNPGHTPIFCIDDVEIPIIQGRKKNGLTTLNVENLTSDVVDFAKNSNNDLYKTKVKRHYESSNTLQ